jgi:hypothetical protein
VLHGIEFWAVRQLWHQADVLGIWRCLERCHAA